MSKKTIKEIAWQKRYAELQAYQAEYWHCKALLIFFKLNYSRGSTHYTACHLMRVKAKKVSLYLHHKAG